MRIFVFLVCLASLPNFLSAQPLISEFAETTTSNQLQEIDTFVPTLEIANQIDFSNHPNDTGFSSKTYALNQMQNNASPTPTGLVPQNSFIAGTGNENIDFYVSSHWWVRAYGGYDYSFLGDIINGTNTLAAFNRTFSYSGGQSANTGNSGIQAGLELGYQMDEDNAFSVNVENIWSQTDSVIYVDAGNTNYQAITPNLFSDSLNYYHYFAQGRNSRLWGI